MRFSIPYLGGVLPLEIPDRNLLAVVEPLPTEPVTDPAEAVRKAIAPADGGAALSDFLAGAADTLVVVNDATRPTPTETLLDATIDLLDASGARFIVATGAHRAPSAGEYRQIFGHHFERIESRILAHDARDAASLADFGATRNGTPILLNRAVAEADRIVVTGSVEPHYFAGFTGGRKAFLPGLAGFATIEANHRLALDPRARALALDDNPVSQDMDDALDRIAAPVYSIMTVLDGHQRLAACHSGGIRDSFRRSVGEATRIFAVPVARRADIVVSVARFPMDIDLYQAQKAIDNGAMALKDGGTLILVASCRDGVGDRAYMELLGSCASPGEALLRIGERYRLGWHKAAKMAQVAARAGILAVTELEAPTLAGAFIGRAENLQAALDDEIARRGGTASVAILPDGTLTVPLLRG